MNQQNQNNPTQDYLPKWYSVKDRPLFVSTRLGWECTEDGCKEFIAAIEVHDNRTGKVSWWKRHCVVEDGVGLCVVGDVENDPAGWELSDVEFWHPFPTSPNVLISGGTIEGQTVLIAEEIK